MIHFAPVIPWKAVCVGVLMLLVSAGLAADANAQIAELPFADTTEAASFGSSVAINGDRAAVGSSGENECGANSGAVYIFERPSGGSVTSWEKTARLTPSDCREGAFFGRDIDLDGDHLLVSSTVEFFADEKPHVAYIFEAREDGSWQEVSQLTPGTDVLRGSFASSVTLDNGRALITARGRGTDSNAEQPGEAYLFQRQDNGEWELRHTFHGMHRNNVAFGSDGALKGGVIAVSASPAGGRSGGVHIIQQNGDNWRETAYLDGFQDEYISIALGEDRLAIGEGVAGSRGEGRVFMYEHDGEGNWNRAQTLSPRLPYDQGSFGMNLAINGPRLLVTGYDEQLRFEFNIDRVVYVFGHDARAGAWTQRRIIDIGEVDFATDIDLYGDTAIVGHVSKRSPGTAFVVQVH